MPNSCVIPCWNNSCSIFNGLYTVYSGHCCLLTLIKEDCMDKNELKKFLAGLSIAGLVAGATLTGFGCATA